MPVISDKYFVQLNEANEAISEVISELSKKPIVWQVCLCNGLGKLFKLSDKKEVLIDKDKEEIIYNQFGKMPPCNFKFKDIKRIVQNEDNIFIFRKDMQASNFTLIIPNYVF